MYILLYSNLTNFIITSAIPFLLLVCFNCKTYLAIRDSLKSRKKLNIRRSSSYKLAEEIQRTQDKNKEILQSMVLFGIIISFFICHVLRVVLNLEEIIYFEDINQTEVMQEQLGVTCIGVQFWTKIAGHFSHFLLQVNSSINFFIYGYVSSQFAERIKRAKAKIFQKQEGSATTIPLTDIIKDFKHSGLENVEMLNEN